MVLTGFGGLIFSVDLNWRDTYKSWATYNSAKDDFFIYNKEKNIGDFK
jgi:hypothetical protein